MLPKELSKIFEEYTEDDYDLYVVRIDYLGESVLFDFVLDLQDLNDNITTTQNWRIHASGHRKNHISFDFAQSIEISDDHPLLWEFKDVQCQLYFSGTCKDPAKLFYDLYLVHNKTFQGRQCFNVSFREEIANFQRFKYSNGLLTQGSKKLMKLYGECLIRNGLEFSIIGERPAKYWEGDQFILESQELKVLFLGDTYIVASDFIFSQMDENSA